MEPEEGPHRAGDLAELRGDVKDKGAKERQAELEQAEREKEEAERRRDEEMSKFEAEKKRAEAVMKKKKQDERALQQLILMLMVNKRSRRHMIMKERALANARRARTQLVLRPRSRLLVTARAPQESERQCNLQLAAPASCPEGWR